MPHYLPAWSSLEATQASLRVDDVGFARHAGRSRDLAPRRPRAAPAVAGLESGSWSGPVGTPYGQLRSSTSRGPVRYLEEAIERRVGLHTDAHLARAR